MHARVWRIRILPGKTEEFIVALRSLVNQARGRHPGYRGYLLLGPAGEDAPDTTLIALWDSFDSMRDSERNFLITQALAHLIQFSEGMPHIVERPVLANNFRSASE